MLYIHTVRPPLFNELVCSLKGFVQWKFRLKEMQFFPRKTRFYFSNFAVQITILCKTYNSDNNNNNNILLYCFNIFSAGTLYNLR